MKYILFLFTALFVISCSNTNTPLENANKKVDISIEGMMCSMGCVSSIKKKLATVEGVVEFEVEFENKKASIVYNPNKVSTTKIVKSIEELHDGMYKVTGINELEAIGNNKANPEPTKASEKDLQHDIKDFHFKIPNIFSILYHLIN